MIGEFFTGKNFSTSSCLENVYTFVIEFLLRAQSLYVVSSPDFDDTPKENTCDQDFIFHNSD